MNTKMVAIVAIVAAVVIIGAAAVILMGGGDKGKTDDNIVGMGFTVEDSCEGNVETIGFKISDYKDGVYTATITDDGETETITLAESKIVFSKTAFGQNEGSDKVTINGKQMDATKYSQNNTTTWVGSDGTVYQISASVIIFGQEISETVTIKGDYPTSEKLYYVYYAFMKALHDTPEEATSEIDMTLESGAAGNSFKMSLEPDHDLGGMQMYVNTPSGYSSEYFGDSEIANIKSEYLKEAIKTEAIETFEGTKTVNVYEVAYETYIYADSPSGTVYRAVLFENIYDTASCTGMDETANCMLAFAFATGRMG
ncbi:MAG: hypothetical protein II933_00710 [Candidatus Methanomethylophilaceae archaeon]|nr:hypothetical protein [Candidatus Methanomethylophilaceae archaeon]